MKNKGLFTVGSILVFIVALVSCASAKTNAQYQEIQKTYEQGIAYENDGALDKAYQTYVGVLTRLGGRRTTTNIPHYLLPMEIQDKIIDSDQYGALNMLSKTPEFEFDVETGIKFVQTNVGASTGASVTSVLTLGIVKPNVDDNSVDIVREIQLFFDKVHDSFTTTRNKILNNMSAEFYEKYGDVLNTQDGLQKAFAWYAREFQKRIIAV